MLNTWHQVINFNDAWFFPPFCFLWWANAQKVVLIRLCSATQKQSKALPELSLMGYNAVFALMQNWPTACNLPPSPDILFGDEIEFTTICGSVIIVRATPSIHPCDLDWLLKALSTASFLVISYFIPWQLTLRHQPEFPEIAVVVSELLY